MRILVTGASGFVGRHLLRALRERGDEVIAAGHASDGEEFVALNLTDAENVRAVVDVARADVVYHLAAQTFVPEAISAPATTYETNIMGTARLFDALHAAANNDGAAVPRVILVSSAEVYGKRPNSDLPFRETLAPLPLNAYAASKVAQEAIGLAAFHTHGLPVIMTRAFNHIGPGQDDRFVVSSFARQLAAIAAGAPRLLLVGNLEAERDFLDVRDVVDAYIALARTGIPGEIYNICSGKPLKIKELLRQLVTIAHVPVEIREDPARMRPVDIPISFGDNAKLRGATDWAPTRPLAETLRAIFAAHQAQSVAS